MNAMRTVIMSMVVTFLAIGILTGLAAAGSTTQTYVGDGTYTTSWNGNGGTMDIDTYTSNGQDHLAIDYQNGHTHGNQAGDTNGWTMVTRDVRTNGHYTSVSAVTIDNSGDLIAIDASAKCGATYLGQRVGMNDDANYDAVVSGHMVDAHGNKYSVGVVALAGYDDQGTPYNPNDDTYSAVTAVDIDGKIGVAGVVGIAGVGSNTNVAASGQAFRAYAYGRGEADITAQGGNAGIGSFYYGSMQVHNDGTWYQAQADGETYINLHDNYNHHYNAIGYIYAVTP